jgi:SAM-dependent methyltransferase
MKRELLIGCGPSRIKKVGLEEVATDWSNLTTLDMDPYCEPDVVHDLNIFPYPFSDNTFNEIHAYEVLEHLGSLGDYKFFFKQFEEIWRILKPDGVFIGMVPGPKSPWIFGDPGHTRIIQPEMIQFLDQDFYNVNPETGKFLKVQSSYYQKIYKGNLKLKSQSFENNGWTYIFMLTAAK